MNKNKTYDGEEIILDEADEETIGLTFLCNGVTIMIDRELWTNIKKELKEALK